MAAPDRELIVRQLAEALAAAWRRQHGGDDSSSFERVLPITPSPEDREGHQEQNGSAMPFFNTG
jgi:hypothetical protein